MGDAKKKPSILLMLEKGHGGMGASDKEEESDPLAVTGDQVDAMREFEAAKGPEGRAQALKAFIRLCEDD